MNSSILLVFFSLYLPFLIQEKTFQSNLFDKKQVITEWLLSDLVSQNSEKIRISGHPEMIKRKYGNALLFNGISDGLFLDYMPLVGLEQFTIEVIVRPDSGGYPEQRFFHCGEVQGDRVLMETRSTKAGWYFDAYIKSSDQLKTLVEPKLLHQFDQWYHIAFVIDHGKLVTYVNGQKELEDQIALVPLKGGKTSIGVRLNEQSWFKGAIYKIKISSKALNPCNFMNYE